jgi:hypothetical protein
MTLHRFCLALCLCANFGAFAATKPARPPAPMTRQAYEAAKTRIGAQYQSNQKTCQGVKGQLHDVCEVEAKGRRDSLLADLEAQFKPSAEASFKAKNVTADANFEVARKKCEAQKGDARDRCVKLAKGSREAAIRQAKVEKVEETGGPFGNSRTRAATASAAAALKGE